MQHYQYSYNSDKPGGHLPLSSRGNPGEDHQFKSRSVGLRL